MTGKYDILTELLAESPELATQDFAVGLGQALLAIQARDRESFSSTIGALRSAVARDLTPSTTSSMHACHGLIFKLHVLYEVEALSGMNPSSHGRQLSNEVLDRRLDVLGAFLAEKQYILALRRAVMQISASVKPLLCISSLL